MKKQNTDRKQNKQFLSVRPVTSRQRTGPTHPHTNIRSALNIKIAQLAKQKTRTEKDLRRHAAALQALLKTTSKEDK